MFELRVPIIKIVTNEGGSGKTLAIRCANKWLMLENSAFYVARMNHLVRFLMLIKARVRNRHHTHLLLQKIMGKQLFEKFKAAKYFWQWTIFAIPLYDLCVHGAKYEQW
ncbi:hypothetical protein AABB24_010793 [Solanum stoloniferum]|uniref:Uncharacterized protein n=1 Tax=Solanum stoloniferum TaxID=62892 RepID=A0ABD2UBQ8_9SOLN